jgi:DNA-binding GntR family transcriptional regulator
VSIATVGETVAAALRTAIAARELRPGDRVRQEEIARRFGVSVIPVREALRVLEGEGQVTYRPRQGYVVAELDLGALAEVYRLRELLEDEAVRVAVERISDADVERVGALFEDVGEALAAGNVTAAMAANRRAHFQLIEAAEMPILLRHVRMLWDSTEAYRALYYADPRRGEGVAREHTAIVEALANRDAERVIEVLRGHRRRALDALSSALETPDHG